MYEALSKNTGSHPCTSPPSCGFEVFGKVERDWPIAKSIRKLIPITLVFDTIDEQIGVSTSGSPK